MGKHPLWVCDCRKCTCIQLPLIIVAVTSIVCDERIMAVQINFLLLRAPFQSVGVLLYRKQLHNILNIVLRCTRFCIVFTVYASLCDQDTNGYSGLTLCVCVCVIYPFL